MATLSPAVNDVLLSTIAPTNDLHSGMAIVAQAMGEPLSSLKRPNVEPDILMPGHRADLPGA